MDFVGEIVWLIVWMYLNLGFVCCFYFVVVMCVNDDIRGGWLVGRIWEF